MTKGLERETLLDEGVVAQERGDFAEARRAFERAVAADPDNARARFHLGTLAFQLGDAARAIAELERAIALDDRDPLPRNNLGLAYQRVGELEEAERSFRAALERKPDYASALNNLGALLHATKRTDEAISTFERATEVAPNFADAFMNLGLIRKGTGDYAKAGAELLEALKLAPNSARAHLELAECLAKLDKREEATKLALAAIQLEPENPATYVTAAELRRADGNLDGAREIYEAALRRAPNDAKLLTRLGAVCYQNKEYRDAIDYFLRVADLEPDDGRAYYNLGLCRHRLGERAEARKMFRRAVELKTDESGAYYNLAMEAPADEALPLLETARRLNPNSADVAFLHANKLLEAGDREGAFRTYGETLEIDPNYYNAYLNHAVALIEEDEDDEAARLLEKAREVAPPNAPMFSNFGAHAQKRLEFEEAFAWYEKALEIDPDYALAHKNRALLNLLVGNYLDGFEEYEWRWKAGLNRREFPKPEWNGEDPTGKTIFIHAEQGLGDTIQFVRFCEEAKRRGARVIFECQKTLVDLLADSPWIDELASSEEGAHLTRPYDYYAATMSLPRIFKTTFETIPWSGPYLFANPKRAEKWAPKLAGEGAKIGLVWAGSPTHKNDRRRSIPFAEAFAAASIPGATVYSLQIGPRRSDFRPREGAVDLGAEIVDFADTAAIVSRLDAVVAVDTSVAHLAGAMGKPVFVLLPYSPDWRWRERGDRTPWYPSARLIRQPEPGDWTSALKEARELLEETVGSKT
jgi:tetratricopeptide (TPR) repeat protein